MKEHVGFYKELFEDEHWRSLSAAAKIYYIHLKARYTGSNNGEIQLTHAAMKGVKGCSSRRKVSKAIKELKSKGWIEEDGVYGPFRFKN